MYISGVSQNVCVVTGPKLVAAYLTVTVNQVFQSSTTIRSAAMFLKTILTNVILDYWLANYKYSR